MTSIVCIRHQILSSNPIKEYKIGESCGTNGEVHTTFSKKSEGKEQLGIYWSRQQNIKLGLKAVDFREVEWMQLAQYSVQP
jgi:hypothetical protein